MALVLLLCFLLLLPSCARGESLEVVSDDFPNMKYLKSGEYDQEEIKNSMFVDYNKNYKHAYKVSEKDGKLLISEGIDDEYQAATLVNCDNGYFVAVDVGEFDSWVVYYDYRTGDHNDHSAPEGRLVTNYNPFKFEQIDSRNIYLITRTYIHWEDRDSFDNSVVYKLWLSDTESEWQWEELPNVVDGLPVASFYHPESELLYLVTKEGLFAVDEKGELTAYEVPEDLWSHMALTSVVRIGDMIYVGSCFGIYASPVDGGNSIWYPLSPY